MQIRSATGPADPVPLYELHRGLCLRFPMILCFTETFPYEISGHGHGSSRNGPGPTDQAQGEPSIILAQSFIHSPTFKTCFINYSSLTLITYHNRAAMASASRPEELQDLSNDGLVHFASKKQGILQGLSFLVARMLSDHS